MTREETIEKIREFNRFYTVSLGMVGKNYKESYSIAESRILYEIRTNPGCTSGYLVQLLKLDKGYISRILKNFMKEGILERKHSAEDARIYLLYLTEKGRAEADRIIEETNEEIGQLLTDCDEKEYEEICRAVNTIMNCFDHRSGKEGEHRI